MKTRRQLGQAMIEYALILLLVFMSALVALQVMGVSVRDVFCRVTSIFTINACSAPLCQDDFDSLSEAQKLQGAWTASNGQICISGAGTFLNKCSQTGMNGANYTASLNGANLTGGNGYGIFFRAGDPGLGVNGYAFQYDPGASGFVIRKWVNGVEINPSLGYKSYPSYKWYEKPHTLSIKVDGDTFTGYVDNVVMLTVKDSTYKSGGSGVRTWDSSNLCIDQFTIKR